MKQVIVEFGPYRRDSEPLVLAEGEPITVPDWAHWVRITRTGLTEVEAREIMALSRTDLPAP